jgi:hypothetical protein
MAQKYIYTKRERDIKIERENKGCRKIGRCRERGRERVRQRGRERKISFQSEREGCFAQYNLAKATTLPAAKTLTDLLNRISRYWCTDFVFGPSRKKTGR